MSTKHTTSLHQNLSLYLEGHRRQYITEEFIYSSYSSPNTMYRVHNDLDELLLTLSTSALHMWHRSLSLLKRNQDPVLAMTFLMSPKLYLDLFGRTTYFKARRELMVASLLIATAKRSIVIINVHYAQKLYNPKAELVVI